MMPQDQRLRGVQAAPRRPRHARHRRAHDHRPRPAQRHRTGRRGRHRRLPDQADQQDRAAAARALAADSAGTYKRQLDRALAYIEAVETGGPMTRRPRRPAAAARPSVLRPAPLGLCRRHRRRRGRAGRRRRGRSRLARRQFRRPRPLQQPQQDPRPPLHLGPRTRRSTTPSSATGWRPPSACARASSAWTAPAGPAGSSSARATACPA